MVELLLEKHVHTMVEPQPGLLVRTSDSIFAIVVVDAKSAPSANHTASRKAGFARAKSRDDVPVNFS
jgi:hypothetical protein